MRHVVRVDDRGRLTLPASMKKRLKIGSLVRVEEKADRLEIVPLRDPLEKLKGSARARVSAERLDELAERKVTRQALK